MTLFRRLRRLAGRLLGAVSNDYRVVDRPEDPDGWRDVNIARRQAAAFAPLLRDLRRGAPRADFLAAAAAVRASGMTKPSLLEIGCGSGYYSEVLSSLVGPLRYTGLDYSIAMIGLAREEYPSSPFLVGDAVALPFAGGAFDLVFSGNSLMHIGDYATSIAEAARVAKRWTVFHSVPIVERRPTTRLSKRAYGSVVDETLFQRAEIESLIEAAGFAIRNVEESIPYDLSAVVGEKTRLVTYACERLG